MTTTVRDGTTNIATVPLSQAAALRAMKYQVQTAQAAQAAAVAAATQAKQRAILYSLIFGGCR